MQAYSDPARESDSHALPNIEVFHLSHEEACEASGDWVAEDNASLEGWYWWSCFPGCLPDSERFGPFATEAEALADAQS